MGMGWGEWLFDRHPWPGAIYKRMALQLQHWPLATVYDGRRSLRGHQSRASLLCAPCRAPAIASYCTLAQVAPQEAKALGHPRETEPQPRASGDENESSPNTSALAAVGTHAHGYVRPVVHTPTCSRTHFPRAPTCGPGIWHKA